MTVVPTAALAEDGERTSPQAPVSVRAPMSSIGQLAFDPMRADSTVWLNHFQDTGLSQLDHPPGRTHGGSEGMLMWSSPWSATAACRGPPIQPFPSVALGLRPEEHHDTGELLLQREAGGLEGLA